MRKQRPDAAAITSRLTSRGRTAIPCAVRTALSLEDGDEIAYRIEAGRAVLTKAAPRITEDPFATFREWDSAADHKAYAGL